MYISLKVGFSEMIRAMQTVTPSCGDMMNSCRWNGRQVACKDIFDVRYYVSDQKMLRKWMVKLTFPFRRTDSGFCCSFNTLNPAQSFDLSDVDVQAIPTTPAAAAGWLNSTQLNKGDLAYSK